MVVIDYADILSPNKVSSNANTYVEQGEFMRISEGLNGTRSMDYLKQVVRH